MAVSAYWDESVCTEIVPHFSMCFPKLSCDVKILSQLKRVMLLRASASQETVKREKQC